MAIEIERKFLVHGDGWRVPSPKLIRQGYLNRDKTRTVRVRISGADAFLTIKGISTGATRAEFEYPIPLVDASALVAICDGPLIEKYRHEVRHGTELWEVDEFLGTNAGLVVAEIELAHEGQEFSRPAWLGNEVTHDSRYFNSNLATRPYSQWSINGDA